MSQTMILNITFAPTEEDRWYQSLPKNEQNIIDFGVVKPIQIVRVCTGKVRVLYG